MTSAQLTALSNDPNSYIVHNTGDILHKVDENSNFIQYSNSRESSNTIHHYTFKVMKSDYTWTLINATDKIITNVSGALSYDADTKTISADHSNLVTLNTAQTITGSKEFTRDIKFTNSGFYDMEIINNAVPGIGFRDVHGVNESKLILPVPEMLETKTLATTDQVAAKSTVSVSASGTATDEIGYITVDGVEKKIAGGGSSYTAGTGIDITNNVISGKFVGTATGDKSDITVGLGTPELGWSTSSDPYLFIRSSKCRGNGTYRFTFDSVTSGKYYVSWSKDGVSYASQQFTKMTFAMNMTTNYGIIHNSGTGFDWLAGDYFEFTISNYTM